MEEKVKQKLLTLLDKFVEVCEQYGLQYYLAGGTVIGAVRHIGFIPWDDDIDVIMPRKDFDRFLSLPDSVFGAGFRLAYWDRTENYTYDIPKLELTNTTIIERLHPDYVGGVFLDIFPLDYLSNDSTEVAAFEKELFALEDRYIECTIKNDIDCRSILELSALKLKRLFYNNKTTMQQWEKLATSYDESSPNYCHSHFYAPYKGGAPIEWFGKGTVVEFEGRKVLAPQNYDAYLKHIFGDYMKLPPIESRKGHEFMFADYDRRLDDDEIEKILKDLHNQHAYRFSLKKEVKYLVRKIK